METTKEHKHGIVLSRKTGFVNWKLRLCATLKAEKWNEMWIKKCWISYGCYLKCTWLVDGVYKRINS